MSQPMAGQKTMLIIRACADACGDEIRNVATVAQMHRIGVCTVDVAVIEKWQEKLSADMTSFGQRGCTFDYVYIAAHANAQGFGRRTGQTFAWSEFAGQLCSSGILRDGATLLLGCCLGGLKTVARDMFSNCTQINHVCGPQYTVTPVQIIAGFHVYIYNVEHRKTQPSVAAKAIVHATGYEFFCRERYEFEDEQEMMNSAAQNAAWSVVWQMEQSKKKQEESKVEINPPMLPTP